MASKTGKTRTPSRRKTMGVLPSNHTSNRVVTFDVSDGFGDEENVNINNNHDRQHPRGRKSMIPRIRENMPPSPPAARGGGGGGVTKSTAASRRRTMGNTDRRQSLAAPPPASSSGTTANYNYNVKPDPRPVNDKAYQQQCIKRLLKFLSESSYEYPISHRSLARPSGKDFVNIVTFLLRRVDKNFQNGTTMKLEDEVATNFKAMGYAWSISKTGMVAAGSPNTWPSLLAALTWMMEHLQCAEADVQEDFDDTSKSFDTLEELQERTEKFFFRYLAQSYRSFLAGDDEAMERAEEELQEYFERDDTNLQEECQRVLHLNSAFAEKIEDLKDCSENLSAHAEERENFATQLEQYEDFLLKMTEHKATLEQKTKERSAQLEENNAKLGKTKDQIKYLEKTIESQELSVEDVRQKESEQKGIKEAMDRRKAVEEEHRATRSENADLLSGVFIDMEPELGSYNDKLSKFTAVPELTSQPSNRRASLDKSKVLESDQNSMLGVDFHSSVLPKLSRLNASYADDIDEAKRSYQDALDKVAKSAEEEYEAGEKMKIVEDKIVKCEEALVRESESNSAQLAVRRREGESMESNVAALRDPVALEEKIAGYERQCAELEALKMKHQEENISQRQAYEDEINETLNMMMEEDKLWVKKLEDLRDYVAQNRQRVGTVSVPDNVNLE